MTPTFPFKIRDAAAWLLIASVAMMGLPAAPAGATDPAALEVSGANKQGGRFLRLALSKSAVIRLPADAKDVIIGDPSITDVVLRQKNMAYLFARNAGQTNIFFFDSNGREILQLDLEVALDTKGLKQLLDRSMPGNRIAVDSTGGNIVIKGTVADAQQAKMAEDLASRFAQSTGSVLNLLKIEQSDQVMLKVRIVELKRTALKELGINFEADVGKFSISNTPDSVINTPGSSVLNSALKIASGGNSLEVRLKALEEQGLATTLAEPTLTAISGASASFLAGGEIPYSVSDTNGTTVQFKPYGVRLQFTPTVLSEDRIALNIYTEVSERARNVDGVPSIDTRNAQTSVELPSGGSMMMAGLIKDVTSQELTGTPGARTIPVLGALFSKRIYASDQTELVVLVTPYIARAANPKNLATPLDNFSPPTDLQQIFLGRLNRVYGAGGERPAGAYHGKFGYIID